MKKSIVNWILGLVISTLGIGLCTRGGLGLSMIAACPYALHHAMIQHFSWFTQGTAEYVFEALLLILLCAILRKFRIKWLLSFVTAVIAGFLIDGWLLVLGGNSVYASLIVRIIAFVSGMCITSLGIAFFFRTTMPLEVYELCVTELSQKFSMPTVKTKWLFDVFMLVTAVAIGLIFEHTLVGVGIATVIMTLINSYLISFCGKLIDNAEKKWSKENG